MGTTSVFSPAAQFGQRRTQSAKTSPNRTKSHLFAATQQQQQQQQQTTVTTTTPTQQPLTMLPLDARPAPPTRIMSAAVAQQPQPGSNKTPQNITVTTTNLFQDDEEDADCSPHPHNLDLNLAKYRLLESQHEALLSHLDSLQLARRPSSQGSTGSSPPSFSSRRSSSASSYYRRRYHSSSARSSTVGGATSPVHHIMSAGPLETVPDGDEVCLFGEDERRLFDVNEAIKRSLTELLNCEQARADPGFRTQIQSRLMEAERELRTGRRRRSCASSVGEH
ncbi:hypothetical protein MCOR27_008359 [Pyricularia oryzae]|uniref:Uncharacterized protein n=2 Tax=Pyricularia TaxID=48558 RepID=A0ABQ8N889_PYRGI|nr:hypothetical protein MCOR01_005419 [Pyricularia oryzae]KAI6292869.1 hypothetical protein MCOR33_009547 [Pyricularia grisea]KAI6252827.1 hypothetical protein MCOR19_010593 [Pyricularia oryzae]KAI6272386.1 hypothetical protein MCOR27_008359 [Pyricularia oryzae]KAI6284761.1 hypothetical protein MCOR34_010976 [Pyricularia oryzae]